MSQPVTVLLIRHATNPRVGKGLTGWLPGISLDDNGRGQAERLAARLASVPIVAIYSSPLERAMETAQPLARLKNLPIVPRDEFGEVHFGQWQGLDFHEIEQDSRWRRFNDLRSGTRAPGGELMLETQARMVRGLLDVAPPHAGRTIAVFSHADAIKAALAHFLGIPLDFHLRLEISPASVSVVDLDDGLPLVRSVNASDATGYH